MKVILFVVPSLNGGGAERVALTLMKHLSRASFDIKLALFKNEGDYLQFIPHDVQVFDLKKRTKFDFFNLVGRLRRIIVKEKPDFVLSFIHYSNIICVLSGLGIKSNCRVIVGEHNFFSKYIKHQRFALIKSFLISFAYRHAYKVIAVSREIARGLVGSLRIPSTKIVTIYNPIDLKEILSKSSEKIDHPILNKRSGFLVCSIGRLMPQKRFDVLINAIALVKKELPVSLIILGQGALLSDLADLVKKRDLSANVHFLGFQDNPYAWLSRADLFVLSSDYEGFPMVLLEAMACRVPAIATNCPSGPGEIILHNQTGLLVGVDDPIAMSKAILSVLLDDKTVQKFKEQAFRSVQAFDVQASISHYEQLLK